MPTVTTFTTTDGTPDGAKYFQDVALSPVTVGSGALLRRFDTLRYPGNGLKVVFPPTVGTLVPAATNEAQSVTEGGEGLTSFTLTFDEETTASIAAAATAAAVQAALAALPSIGIGGVAVPGDAGGPYTVSFIGALANTDVALMTATPTGGTGTVEVEAAGTGAANYEVALVGTYFDPGVVVAVSGTGITVTNLRRRSDGNTLLATLVVAAGATAGARDVTVTNLDTGAVTATGAFTVT